MGYPVSYRSGARKYGGGGFQNPLTVPPGRGPGRPANDNWPKPANDNDPGAPRVSPPKDPPFPGAPSVEDFAIQVGEEILPPQVRKAYEIGKAAYQAYEWFRNPTAYPEVDMGTDWRLVCGPVFAPAYTGPYRWYATDLDLCGLGMQAGGTAPEPVSPYIETGWMLVKLDASPVGDPMSRWSIVQSWTRKGDYNRYSKYKLGPLPRYGARPWFPMAVPNPLPATVENPLPASVPAPVGNAMPSSRPMPATMPRVNPGTLVYTKPEYVRAENKWPELSPEQAGKPVVVVAPGTVANPIREPPGPGTKERKGRMGSAAARGALGIAAGIYEDAKFYNDVLNAWYHATPGDHNAKTPAEKALYIYRNADKIDINKAVLGVLAAVAGEKAGAYLDRARRTAGDNLGLNMYITIPTGSAPKI